MNARKATLEKTDFAFQVTIALIRFLQRAGLSQREIDALVLRARGEARKKTAKTKLAIDSGIASIIGAAFHSWFREKPYIGNNGKPKPLPILGKKRSIIGLIERQNPPVPASVIANELVRLKMIRRTTGKLYVPTALHTLIRNEHPFLSEHVALSIIRLLNTVYYNANGKAPRPPLIERFAHVASIPKGKVREFRDFTTQQGEALIDTINDWLEANKSRKRKSKGKTDIQAGLHVFAYLGDSTTQS